MREQDSVSTEEQEHLAASPQPIERAYLKSGASLPYGCTPEHVFKAMQQFIDFLGLIDQQLCAKNLDRLESFLMPANFSSIVGEFMVSTIPKHCTTLVKNRYHNGHPDLLPKGMFSNDAVQYGHEGIEVKASRNKAGWQGHNPEEVFLLMFTFSANSPRDKLAAVPPKPFRFAFVAGAKLSKSDWTFAGRSETSRRTITASVTESGHRKMMANLVYRDERGDDARRPALF